MFILWVWQLYLLIYLLYIYIITWWRILSIVLTKNIWKWISKKLRLHSQTNWNYLEIGIYRSIIVEFVVYIWRGNEKLPSFIAVKSSSKRIFLSYWYPVEIWTKTFLYKTYSSWLMYIRRHLHIIYVSGLYI